MGNSTDRDNLTGIFVCEIARAEGGGELSRAGDTTWLALRFFRALSISKRIGFAGHVFIGEPLILGPGGGRVPQPRTGNIAPMRSRPASVGFVAETLASPVLVTVARRPLGYLGDALHAWFSGVFV